MGTMIHLALGRLEVDWGKNNSFTDHGALYQESDRRDVPSYYASDDWPDGDPIIEMNEGLAKPLRQVRERLELLGYTLPAVQHQYEKLMDFHEIDADDPPISYDDLRAALAKVDVTKVNGTYSDHYDPGEFARKEIVERLSLSSETHTYDGKVRPDHWEIDLLLENFGANGALRLLAENPANLDLDVSWDFTPLLESGWGTKDEFRPGARPEQRFLIVTEGSSDASILKKALELYRPHIVDFFRFVDMQEGYPFTGTGNLHKFTQGLISIGVQNNTVILYDNDADGTAKMKETSRLSLPPNMRVMRLPQHPDFLAFRTLGPMGESVADVNGKAAAIECYLDLERNGLPPPVIRWTFFNRELQIYQGELQQKAQYMKHFLEMRMLDPAYNSSRIEAALDALVAQCVSIAEARQTAFP